MTFDDAMAFFSLKKRHYQQTFNKIQPSDMIVLSDLAKFCRAGESTFHPDPRVAANLDGRREVFLHIAQYLNLTVEQIVQLHAGNVPAILEQTRSSLND
jgi:hypothetical protein